MKFEETLKLELQRREEYITENSVFERRSKQLIKDLDEATALTQKQISEISNLKMCIDDRNVTISD